MTQTYENIFKVGEICRFNGILVQILEISQAEHFYNNDIITKWKILTTGEIESGSPAWAHNGSVMGTNIYPEKAVFKKLSD